jgi:hypothetical protein
MQMPMECAVQQVLTVYMSSMAGVFYEAGSAYSSRTPVFKPGFFGRVRFAHCFVFFCVVRLCVFTFLVPCCDVRYDFRNKQTKRCSIRLCPLLLLKLKN